MKSQLLTALRFKTVEAQHVYFLFSSLSQEAHCVIMGIIGQGHCISSGLFRGDESSSCNSFAHFCAKPKALGCDVTTAGVELFMGKTPTVQFYCYGLIMCGPFGLSAYAFAIISTSVAAISPDTLVPPLEISLVVCKNVLFCI